MKWSKEKMKEMNPKEKGPGKCASPNATTISCSVNKVSCAIVELYAVINE